jgi:hypothetical protein
LGNRLPRFTEAQSKLVKGSIDFLALSYYSAGFAETIPSANGVNVTFWTDVQSNITSVNTHKLSPFGISIRIYIYIYIYICHFTKPIYVNGFADGVHPTRRITKACFIYKRKIQQSRYIHNGERYNNFSHDIYLPILFLSYNRGLTESHL